MSTFLEDLNLAVNMIDEFLTNEHIVKGLNSIVDIGITGWEKWWQIEFGLFLDQYPGLTEWDMEHEFEVDRRTSDGDRLFIDFGFKMKGWPDSYVFLELKQDDDYKKCINQMFKDAEKLETLKTRSLDGVSKRNVYVIGLFRKYDVNYILQYFVDTMRHYDFKLEDDEYEFLESKNTDWMILVL
ncbi:MAG: hypothetical protein AB2552_01175 [Candidatus Thiodiazotropha endolucinida]